MNIGEVTTGEYGVNDGRRRTYYGDLPRHVEVLGIEKVEQEVWLGKGYTSTKGTRTVRKVRVRFLDEPTKNGYGWHDSMFAVPKGTERLIEARFIVAPWKELRKDVLDRISERNAINDAEAAYEARIAALLPKAFRKDWTHIDATSFRGYGTRVRGSKLAEPHIEVSAKLSGRVLDHILDLAEKATAKEAA